MRQFGFTLVELLVTVAVVVTMLMLMLPGLAEFYDLHQLDTAATTVDGFVQQARIKALKEKVSYRLVIHDDSATNPNRLELQRFQGGSWITVPHGDYTLPVSIDILGAGAHDSADSVTVSKRGECTSGIVFLRSEDGNSETVKVESTCMTDRS